MVKNTLVETISLTAIICFVIFSCSNGQEKKKQPIIKTSEGVDYSLMNPDQVFQLPYDLEEVSGLSYFRDSIIVAVQDELGKLYFYDYINGELLDDFSFGKEGDYEGVEKIGDVIYAVKSNGVIYKIDAKAKAIKQIKTSLKTKNDVEGLGYDSKNNRLILACKGSPAINKGKKNGRAFYAYDLDKDELIEKPIFRITNKEISTFLKEVGIKIEVQEFKPSGIAIHPITGHAYILAHGGKWLLILDESHDIIGASSLRNKLFRQPEGICFTPNGDLLISNEGQGGRGTLLYYKYNKSE